MSLCSYVLNLIRKGYIHLISHVLINYPLVGYVSTLYRRGIVAINKKDRPKIAFSRSCAYKYVSAYSFTGALTGFSSPGIPTSFTSKTSVE